MVDAHLRSKTIETADIKNLIIGGQTGIDSIRFCLAAVTNGENLADPAFSWFLQYKNKNGQGESVGLTPVYENGLVKLPWIPNKLATQVPGRMQIQLYAAIVTGEGEAAVVDKQWVSEFAIIYIQENLNPEPIVATELTIFDQYLTMYQSYRDASVAAFQGISDIVNGEDFQTVISLNNSIPAVAAMDESIPVVAGMSASVPLVAGVKDEIPVLSPVVSQIEQLALIKDQIVSLEAEKLKITAVEAKLAEIQAVHDKLTEIVGVYGKSTEIDALYVQLETIAAKVNQTDLDLEIKAPLLTSIDTVINLVDYNDSDIIYGGYIGSTGTLTVNSLFNCTGFIPVRYGKKYTSSLQNQNVTWWDKDKNFIGYTDSGAFSGAGYVEVTYANAMYARFIGRASEWDVFQVHEDDTYRKNRGSYPTLNNLDVTKPLTRIRNNLFKTDNAVYGYYLHYQTGVPTVNKNCGYVMLDVVPDSFYFGKLPRLGYNGGALSAPYFIVGFDANGNYVNYFFTSDYGYFSTTTDRFMIKIPPTVVKIGVSFTTTANIEDAFIIQNFHDLLDADKINSYWLGDSLIKRSEDYHVYDIFGQIPNDGIFDGYISSGGSIFSSTTIASSIPIPVKEGEIYELSNYASEPTSLTIVGTFLTQTLGWVSSITPPKTAVTQFTIPSGVAYISILWIASDFARPILKKVYSPSYATKIATNALYPPIAGAANGWNGKKWVSLGDSITYREEWQPFVITEFGLIHTNCGIGSTYLAGTSATAFWQDVRLDAVKLPDPDVVTILGGANDLGANIPIGTDAEFELTLANKDKTNFKGAYSYIVENLLTWKPTLRLFLLTTTYGHADGDDINPASGLRYADYAQATREVALFYGIPCIDLHGESGFNKMANSTYLPDNIHPNTAGGKRIAEVVIGVMKRFNPL